MATIIEQAFKGQRKAMESLYQSSKQRVYYVSLLLLGDETQAAEAASFAFKNVWESMKMHPVSTENEFTLLAVRKAVDYCKGIISKQNPKAFRIPQNRNFLLTGDKAVSADCEDVLMEILALLPELQRFILVLHTAGGYESKQIAATFKLDVKTVDLALDAEKTNIERIIRHLDENRRSYQAVIAAIRDGEQGVPVPNTVGANAEKAIDGIASPIESKKRRKITLTGIVAAVLCLCIAGGIFFTSKNNNVHTSDTDSATSADSTDNTSSVTDTTYTPTALDESLTYYADIDIADYGTVTVKLDQTSAPITAANFVSLAESGFYDGLTFHRIIENFMMQGGDPNGNGTGGSENTIVGEFTDNGYDNKLSHTRGAISMARSTDYNSASSQFFIVHEDSTSLDGEYAVFGYVTEGLEIVDKICESAEPTDGNGTIPAAAQPVITSIKIRTE